jgi:hypothetical protein
MCHHSHTHKALFPPLFKPQVKEGGGTHAGPSSSSAPFASLPRLSPVGCSILVCVLAMGQGACRQFTDSVCALQVREV